MALNLGKVEHSITSSVKEIIPESVKEAWHKVWQSFKKAETNALGDGDISDRMEMATWGVEKAEEQSKNAASMLTPVDGLIWNPNQRLLKLTTPLQVSQLSWRSHTPSTRVSFSFVFP